MGILNVSNAAVRSNCVFEKLISFLGIERFICMGESGSIQPLYGSITNISFATTPLISLGQYIKGLELVKIPFKKFFVKNLLN